VAKSSSDSVVTHPSDWHLHTSGSHGGDLCCLSTDPFTLGVSQLSTPRATFSLYIESETRQEFSKAERGTPKAVKNEGTSYIFQCSKKPEPAV
jgi:hypothetical protein